MIQSEILLVWHLVLNCGQAEASIKPQRRTGDPPVATHATLAFRSWRFPVDLRGCANMASLSCVLNQHSPSSSIIRLERTIYLSIFYTRHTFCQVELDNNIGSGSCQLSNPMLPCGKIYKSFFSFFPALQLNYNQIKIGACILSHFLPTT